MKFHVTKVNLMTADSAELHPWSGASVPVRRGRGGTRGGRTRRGRRCPPSTRGTPPAPRRGLPRSRRSACRGCLRPSGGNCIKIGLPGKRSLGCHILLKIVSENRFSGKTYFIQLVPVHAISQSESPFHFPLSKFQSYRRTTLDCKFVQQFISLRRHFFKENYVAVQPQFHHAGVLYWHEHGAVGRKNRRRKLGHFPQ